MALKNTVKTIQGIEIQNAYRRVEGLSLIGKENMKFLLRSYADKSKSFFQEDNFVCAYDINGKNPIAQAYEHLKSLPQFSDAVDC